MNINCTCHICKNKFDGDRYSYLVRYPLGLYKLRFCCEEHRDEYIKRHIVEYYRGVPIYQQFNFTSDGRTVYMLDYFSGEYADDIQVIKDYID